MDHCSPERGREDGGRETIVDDATCTDGTLDCNASVIRPRFQTRETYQGEQACAPAVHEYDECCDPGVHPEVTDGKIVSPELYPERFCVLS
jgi:hypothetical protein